MAAQLFWDGSDALLIVPRNPTLSTVSFLSAILLLFYIDTSRVFRFIENVNVIWSFQTEQISLVLFEHTLNCLIRRTCKVLVQSFLCV